MNATENSSATQGRRGERGPEQSVRKQDRDTKIGPKRHKIRKGKRGEAKQGQGKQGKSKAGQVNPQASKAEQDEPQANQTGQSNHKVLIRKKPRIKIVRKRTKRAKQRKRGRTGEAPLTDQRYLHNWAKDPDKIRPEMVLGEGEESRAVTPREFLMTSLLKIRDKQGRLQPLQLNAAQREYAKNCSPHNIVLKARQLGITTYVAARFFVNCITRPGTLCVQVAHDQRSAEEIFRIVHRLLANLPESLRRGVLTTSHANVRQIVFPRLDSQYRVETAADPNAGRGLTIHNLHCSEVARWPRDAAATLASLRAAVPPDGEIVLESTANGAGGCFYEEWQRAEQTGYTRHFFPWWWEPSYRRPVEAVKFTEQELELMAKHGLTAGQIAFRREIRANFGQRAAEEYAEDAESCFLASGECVFDVEAVQQRLSEPAKVTESRENGRLLIFLPPMKGETGAPREYIIGVDPAGGGADGDYACAQVIERSTGMQCAELRGHYTPQELAARVALLGREYNTALVAVERNNHGHAVLAHLTMNEGYLELYKTCGQPGWWTSAVTRPRMLENFAAVLTSAPFLFASPRLLEECRTFVRRPDGNSAAANGAHDDTVMAMAIALAVRAEVAVRPPTARPQLGVATLG